jgi:hypothetical protein
MKPPPTKLGNSLGALSREEKLELLRALEEKERRAVTIRDRFKPHEGQLKVVTSTALERYLFCGNGYGKSALLVNEVHWAATGFNPITGVHSPVPAKICLLLDSPEKIEDFISEYRRWHPLTDDQLEKRGKPHISFIGYDNGTGVTILTHAVEPLKLEGSQWTHLFGDEPPPKPVFTALFRGGRIKGRPCKVFLAGTPISAAWLRTDVYEPWLRGETPHVACFTGHSKANAANLEEGWLERFGSKLSEREKAIRLEGQFYDLEGLALAHLWRDETHIITAKELNWQADYPCVVVVDPHPSKKHVAILMGADRDNQLYVLAEYAEKAITRKFTRSLIALGWFTNHRILDIVVDSLGSADTTSGEGFRSFIEVMNEELKKHDIGHARATRYEEKDDEAWIERIRDSLALPDVPDSFGKQVPKLRVVQGCGGTITDVKNVQWVQDKNKENKPKLDISNKDYLACVKYGLATNLNFHRKKDKIYYRTTPTYGIKPKVINWARRR